MKELKKVTAMLGTMLSQEEIEEFMDKLDRRINDERAEKKLLASQKEIYKAQQ